jgi:predicted ArsR family transcriptional regulator
MSVLDRLFGKDKAIPASATFRITEEGRDKLQEFNGDPRSRILVALETRGSSSLNEISNVSRVNRGQVERLIPGLISSGCIQYVNTMSGGE